MKNKKIAIIASLVLVLAMLLSSFSVAAVDVTQTPTTGVIETTTAATDDEHSDEYWDGYYDGYNDAKEEIENEDYDSGYDDGYVDGVHDGYWDGYYEGYYDGVNDVTEPTIFEKIENFFAEFRYRIENFFYRIQDFFERLFKIGDYTPSTPVDPDADFIPDGTQPTLEGNADAEALCIEFNNLIEDFKEIKAPVAVTKNVEVGIQAKDIPAVAGNIVNEIIEQFLIDDSTTNNYVAGDYAYEVQSTQLFPAGLASAEKTVNEDGTTDYKFVVIAEAAYYNGNYTTGLKYINGSLVETDLQHDYVADTLYVEVADLGPITISSAEIYYPGATITAKTDANGRLIAYDVNMPVSGVGTAKVAMINLTSSLEGYRNEGFVMTYAD